MALYFKSCLVWLKFAVHGRKMQNKESDQMSKFHVDTKARYSHVHVYTAVHILRTKPDNNQYTLKIMKSS